MIWPFNRGKIKFPPKIKLSKSCKITDRCRPIDLVCVNYSKENLNYSYIQLVILNEKDGKYYHAGREFPNLSSKESLQLLDVYIRDIIKDITYQINKVI